MKKIPLTQGLFAIVDTADYASVSKHNWHAHRTRTVIYASRKVRNPDGTQSTQFLHYFVMGRKGIDHIDGDGLNNRRKNLRPCSSRQNGQALRVKFANKSSQFRGVSWQEPRKKWVAHIHVNDKTAHLGYFVNEADAACAYDAAAREHFGVFAAPNFPA